MKGLKNLNKKLVLAFWIISMMGLSAFPIFVNAGIVPPDDDPPPRDLNCEAQVRAYRSGGLQFTFKVVAGAIVGEIYGNPLLVVCYGLFEEPIDWRPFNNFVWDILGIDHEYYYNFGSQRVGYKLTVTFRIRNRNNGFHLDFELSACVHLWYYEFGYRKVSWNVPAEGPGGPWVLILDDVSKNPQFIDDWVGLLLGGPY
ncbi:MAG: hypothetical protein CEE43_19020 [Promethearchaeota archaeon Loki_b32]|nr:MAG: hypothetical protein CEE43_19020 [Candidatus Lokiarchaeota archaeon Loki_b32]